MKIRITNLAFILSVFLVACEKDTFDPSGNQPPQAPINQDSPVSNPSNENSNINSIQYYFDLFEEEAFKKGFNIDLEALGIYYTVENIEGEFVAGSCTYNSHAPNKVTIDTDFWQNSTQSAKEMVVFHELGHCVLGRDHREGRDTDGFCISIMRSGDGSCKDTYSAQTKEYYMLELFNEFYFNELFN